MLIPLKLVRDQRLQQQLYEQLRDLIVTDRLQNGTRMPSTRMMAEQFAISRITVLLTYERLIAEGYLETLPAKGTFVTHSPAKHAAGVPVQSHGGGGEPPASADEPDSDDPDAAFFDAASRVGRPDPSLFPVGRWRSLMRDALDHLGSQVVSEHPGGSAALRTAIVGWLSASRGLAVTPDQVILLNGRQQALNVAAHLALRTRAGAPRRAVAGALTVVEAPGDAAAAAALVSEGGRLLRIPVDADGLRTDRLPETDVALAHVTPEHQRPLGVTMSRERRVALLAWAERNGALILEEDCDGELRYGDMRVPSLMSLDTADNVIHLGGFCASLGPWLEGAYLVLPLRLVGAALATRRLIDGFRGSLEQTALAGFVSGGGYARHLHRITKAYASRRDALVTALRRHFGMPSPIWGQHSGLHVAWFPSPGSGPTGRLAALARHCGLEAAALPAGTLPGLPGRSAVLVGFGTLPERQIEARVARFAMLAYAESEVSAQAAD